MGGEKYSVKKWSKNTPWITPAWAGKSFGLFGPQIPSMDHPRVGGEKPVAMHNLTTKAGSPPRGRGKV